MGPIRPVHSVVLLLGALAFGCDEPVAPQRIEGTTIILRNELRAPVTASVNGIAVGEIGAGQQRTIRRGDLADVEIDWQLVRPRLGELPIGDSLGARFSTGSPGDGEEITFSIDNVISDGVEEVVYYAPVVTNATAEPIVLGFDMGTPRELRFGELAAGSRERFVGYFRLDRSTTIRAYRPRVAYGPMLFVERAYGHAFDARDIADGSGALSVVFDSDPP